MPEATITSKGRITIPKEVREALNVQAGDMLDFVINERGEVTVRTLRGDVRRLRGMLKHLVKRPLSVDEMDEAILRRHARKR